MAIPSAEKADVEVDHVEFFELFLPVGVLLESTEDSGSRPGAGRGPREMARWCAVVGAWLSADRSRRRQTEAQLVCLSLRRYVCSMSCRCRSGGALLCPPLGCCELVPGLITRGGGSHWRRSQIPLMVSSVKQEADAVQR